MTLFIAVPLSLLAGILVRPLAPRVVSTVAVWYLCLAAQTAYLAKPGQTGFGGVEGTDALRGPLYWAIQPALLAICVGLSMVGANVIARRRQRGSASVA